MIDDFVQEFWKERARSTDASIRWTDAQMLELDVALLESVASDGDTLLDLGCGTGDLFLPLLDRLGHVTAVDMIPDFLDRILADPRITTVVAPVDEFRPAAPFDLAVMFGVVTYLTPEKEMTAYRVLREAAPHGIVIVKNQCGREADLEIDRWSEAFQSQYMARYPHVDRQAESLRGVFGSVDVVPYPEEVNRWDDSMHAAFVCR